MVWSKQKIHKAAWFVGVVLCGVMGYVGWQFIQIAEQSAANIKDNVAQPVPLPQTDWRMNQASAPAFEYSRASEPEINPSNGKDTLIQQGTLIQQDNGLNLQIKLHNQAKFDIGAVHIKVTIYADDKKTVLGTIKSLPIKLESALPIAEETVATVHLGNPDWLQAALLAQNKKALVQIIAVSDMNLPDIGYPQNSKNVWLSELPNIANADNNQAPEIANNDNRMPTATDETETRAKPNEDAVDAILKDYYAAPTGESRVLSHEVKQGVQPAPDADKP
ncbi:hypothetical protein QGZ99_09635 [Kingella kingae]|uniref:Uncharacterized protein n=2 Tax=Kingella kingae TaxID=504 RepID=F5S8N2_KINKI|nr:hypothetical protein [Kingella kingae]EGK08012.1 hypothetical protein HMPREF0476_1565 [Kingella kingae ATCC 23330]MDK4535321.1 hypothetical protein [Kingella kingae]MDK4541834.1 hypothetical protein [Kingella kingae]MDK4554358.1 hypothetical protein [Kingella kingae]UOP02516.1 hypothetical protein LVJ79_07875 [Kingella kingae]